MTDNIYERLLNIPVEFNPVYDQLENWHTNYNVNLINLTFLNWFKERGIIISLAERFYLSAGKSSPLHIDRYKSEQSEDIVKINYVYCETPSLMHWYKLKPRAFTLDLQTDIGSTYTTIRPSQAILVHSAQIGKPSLVNAGIPHSVSKVESERFCFSLLLLRADTGEKILWNEALDILSDCVVK